VVVIKSTVEYVGFHSTEQRREYILRLRTGDVVREYTIGIALAAFATGHVRYQDGPEICFLKLNSELDASGEPPQAADFTVSEEELSAYRSSHPAAKNRLSPRPTPTGVGTPTPQQ